MVVATVQHMQPQSINRTEERFGAHIRELVVFCPGCKTLETLWFNKGWLIQTCKFNQQGEQVFHDCGTAQPCRLYRPY